MLALTTCCMSYVQLWKWCNLTRLQLQLIWVQLLLMLTITDHENTKEIFKPSHRNLEKLNFTSISLLGMYTLTKKNKPRQRDRISDAIFRRTGSPVVSSTTHILSMTFAWSSDPPRVALNADNSFVLAWEMVIDGISLTVSSPISSSEYINPANRSGEWIDWNSLP